MNGKEIANTILNQLGGNKFTTMVGASHLGYDEKGSLSLRFKMCKKMNHLKIEYDRGRDLYNLTFTKIWGIKVKTIQEHTGIYADMLQDIFTSETGLYTSL